MKRFSTFFSTLTVAMTLPGLAMASTCDQLCSATKDSVKGMIADPKCKASATCVDCVAKGVLDGQQGAQCQGLTAAKKSATSQTISTALYTATGITCGISCAITLTGYGSSLEQPLSKACGGLGLASSVVDIGLALAANDIAGGLMGAVGGISTAKNSISMMKNGLGLVKGQSAKEATKQAKSQVCLNAAIYLATAVMKGISQKKMKKSQANSCGIVESFAKVANAPVQACFANVGTAGPTSTDLAGFFTPTPDTFPTVSVDDVNRENAVAGQTGDFLKSMKGDLETAASTGKIDFNDIAKRVDAGEDISSIAAGAGLPAELMDPIKAFEEKAKAGGASPYLASLSGGSYGGGTTAVAAGGESGANGNESLAFGNSSGATPGETADTLEIDRKPAAVSAVSESGDVFHGAYAGTIFDIVTTRLKAQKGNYAELVPEGRMNRLFNGFGEPTSKKSAK